MDGVVDADLLPKQVAFGIKSAYPFRRFFNRFREQGNIRVWYPWYYVCLRVKMDTYLKKGLVYNDIVAVDGLRPVRERVPGLPQESGSIDSDPGSTRLEPKITPDEATAEAVDLMKGIVLSRNKLLKEYDIEEVSTRLYYLKTYVVKLENSEPGGWLFFDPHFDVAARLAMRPEVFKTIQKQES